MDNHNYHINLGSNSNKDFQQETNFSHVSKVKTNALMNEKISSRPTIADLIKRNIITAEDLNILNENMKKLRQSYVERNSIRYNLNNHLSNRNNNQKFFVNQNLENRRNDNAFSPNMATSSPVNHQPNFPNRNLQVQQVIKKYSFHQVDPNKKSKSYNKTLRNQASNSTTKRNEPDFQTDIEKNEINYISEHQKLIEQRAAILNYEMVQRNAEYWLSKKMEIYQDNQNNYYVKNPLKFIDSNPNTIDFEQSPNVNTDILSEQNPNIQREVSSLSLSYGQNIENRNKKRVQSLYNSQESQYKTDVKESPSYNDFENIGLLYSNNDNISLNDDYYNYQPEDTMTSFSLNQNKQSISGNKDISSEFNTDYVDAFLKQFDLNVSQTGNTQSGNNPIMNYGHVNQNYYFANDNMQQNYSDEYTNNLCNSILNTTYQNSALLNETIFNNNYNYQISPNQNFSQCLPDVSNNILRELPMNYNSNNSDLISNKQDFTKNLAFFELLNDLSKST